MELHSEHRRGACIARLWNADAVELLRSLEAGSVDLIVTSPPYFIGKEYDTSRCSEDFLREIKRITREINRVLKPGGSLCWQVGNHVKSGVLVPLDVLIGSALLKNRNFALRNRIIWTFNHGAHESTRFSGRHETILWYSKGAKCHFDLDRVRVPQIYPGKRHYKGPNRGEWSGNPLGKNPGDVWDIGDIWRIPNVKANHVEKTEHPCQFPTALVRRLVRALSPEGGTVADPYAGAATTGVAALLEDRSFVGSEIEPRYLRIAEARLDSLVSGTLQVRADLPARAPTGNEKVAASPPHFLYGSSTTVEVK